MFHPNSTAGAVFLGCMSVSEARAAAKMNSVPVSWKDRVCPTLGACSPGDSGTKRLGHSAGWVGCCTTLTEGPCYGLLSEGSGEDGVRRLGLGPETWRALMGGYSFPLTLSCSAAPLGAPGVLNSGAEESLKNLVSFTDGYFLRLGSLGRSHRSHF